MRKRYYNIISGIFVLLLIIIGIEKAKAQNASDLRFNEILVYNNSNCIDDFGIHSSWIELFNSAYNSVNIGGCYLTNDLNDPKKYWIPTGDPTTVVPPRCYILFWADNKPTRGIFHLNFELKDAKTLALFDANGRTIIDKLEIVQPQKIDTTYGRIDNNSNQWVFLDHSTPGANNDYSQKVSAGESFVRMDPYGIGMTMIAMFVVFSALAILYIIYNNLGKFFQKRASSNNDIKDNRLGDVSNPNAKREITGEVNAAIAMALYLYQTEMHDHENTVLTIQKVSRTYSPWSSKIYSLRKSPR